MIGAFLFTVIWWVGLCAVALTVVALLMVAFVSVREAAWNRDRRAHLKRLRAAYEQPAPARLPSFYECEALLTLPDGRPRGW